MIKSFKIRLYPTKSQEQLMWRHIGCCRFIWNYMLDLQENRYRDGEKHLSAFDMNNLLKPLKDDGAHDWLREVAHASLQRACGDLNEAYQRAYKKTARFPKFKSKKKAKQNYPVRADSLYLMDNRLLHLEKLGRVRYKTDFDLPKGRGHKFSNPRISYKNGKWMLSFGLECENQARELNDYSVGIDLGVKETMVVAYGDEQLVFHNINKGRKVRQLKKRMKHLRRSISRKYEASKLGNAYVKTSNIARQEDKLRKLYSRLTGIRTNYIHQSTHKLIELLPRRVVMEDLNVQGMMKNRHLSKAIQEQCFYEILRQMKYKCEWNGIEFVQANRFYPSSKTCSHCGCVHKGLKLKDRTFICPECGFTIDRDYQAALNLSRYAA